VDERHGGPLPGRGDAGHRWAEVVNQLADGRFGLLVTGFAAADCRELKRDERSGFDLRIFLEYVDQVR
jgi:hypothetical protein